MISNVVVIDASSGIAQGLDRHPRGPHLRGSAGPATPTRSTASTSSSAPARRSSPGEGLIATAGAIDTHVHLLSPRDHGGVAGLRRHHDHRPGVRARVGRRRELPVGAAPRVQRLRRVAGEHRLPRPRLVLRPGARWSRRSSRAAPAGSRSTRTWARTPAPWTPRCGSPRSTTCRSRCTPTGSTSASRSRTRSPCWRAAPIHAFHIEGCGGGHVPERAAPGRGGRTSSAPRPTRRCPFGRDALAEHYRHDLSPCTGCKDRPARRRGHGPRPHPRRARWAPRTCCTTSA